MTSIPTLPRAISRSSFPALAGLYVLLFGAFGSESPFFALFLQSRGRTIQEIAILLSVGTLVRVAAGLWIGLVADRIGVRVMLAVTIVAASAIGTSYLFVASFAAFLAVAVLHAAVLTSITPLCDALALSASEREKTFSYGWVRGIGSGSFAVATLASGAMVGAFGPASIVVASSVLFLAMSLPLGTLAEPVRDRAKPTFAGLAALLANGRFLLVLLVAALVIGSQSMSDTYAVIHWTKAGVSPRVVGLLWAEAVAAELLVFALIGPYLLRRYGPGACLTLGALAGIVQWGSLALTTAPALLALSQPLHGLTFALTHLSAMAVIAVTVPPERATTAQAIYGMLALGLASAIVTFASGPLWASFGAQAFWLMAALCVLAIPFAVRTARSPEGPSLPSATDSP